MKSSKIAEVCDASHYTVNRVKCLIQDLWYTQAGTRAFASGVLVVDGLQVE